MIVNRFIGHLPVPEHTSAPICRDPANRASARRKIIASANGCTESAPAAPALMLASGSIVTTLRPRRFQVRRPFACHVVIFVRGQYSR